MPQRGAYCALASAAVETCAMACTTRLPGNRLPRFFSCSSPFFPHPIRACATRGAQPGAGRLPAACRLDLLDARLAAAPAYKPRFQQALFARLAPPFSAMTAAHAAAGRRAYRIRLPAPAAVSRRLDLFAWFAAEKQFPAIPGTLPKTCYAWRRFGTRCWRAA